MPKEMALVSKKMLLRVCNRNKWLVKKGHFVFPFVVHGDRKARKEKGSDQHLHMKNSKVEQNPMNKQMFSFRTTAMMVLK